MLHPRFAFGLAVGLAVGVLVGALIAFAWGPSPSSDAGATALQIQELTRKLEIAKDDRQRMERQLDQFQALAERMTSSFNNLEERFKALGEQHQREDEAAGGPRPPAPGADTPPKAGSQ